jgi:endonuclease YncB( thermonuclease family)
MGRLIAVVYDLKDVNINKLLVKNGLALHYKRYSKDDSYSDLENKARINKLGMWQQSKVIEPWVFRKRKK